MLNGGLLADEDEWGGSGVRAVADREDARADLAHQADPADQADPAHPADPADPAEKDDSTKTGSELVWTHVGHSLSSRPVSVLPGPDCAYRFVVSSPMACFPTASLRSMSRVAFFQLPPRAASAPA